MPEAEGPEIWAPIPTCDGYEASSHGRIRSLDRSRSFDGRWGPVTRRYKGRVLKLKPKPNGCGGVYHCFYSDGDVYWQVNRAVCWAFHGAPPSDKHEAAHLDGDTTNNVPPNLCWATPIENAAHKERHGTVSRGEKNGAARLTEQDAAAILERYAGGDKAPALAAEFNVSPGSILNVVSGSTWAHVASTSRPAAQAMARQNMLEQLAWNH